MKAYGQYKWVIPGGRIPFETTGKEPYLLSQDKISVLNMNENDVELTMTVFYSNSETVGPFKLTVKANRVRKVRVNDFIDPFPIDLERDYALIIEANKPLVIQFTRMDTGNKKGALMGGMAFPADF